MLRHYIKESHKTMKPVWSNRLDINISKIENERAGFMPYLRTKEGIKFCMAIDNKTKELTDFAGLRSQFDRDVEDTALRQCRLKSLSIFDFTKRDLDKYKTLYVFDEKSLIVLIDVTPLGLSEDDYLRMFEEKLLRVNFPRIAGIKWVPAAEVIKIISRCMPVIYNRVRSLIRDISKIVPIIEVGPPLPE